ncbi:MAG: energy-coupling factor ABC transporter ATP-binding protein [Merdimonas faecis]|uniref:energy-coupling factor ABC transporter ATP-binding protein n=1 Tax=Merdimonas faecis TaxID=1653435 RepID=UPI00399080AF
MDSIQIKNLTYRYPTSEADVLKDVSFTVKKGELCAIVGANGSGKTTLCNAIRGFVPKFYKGEISGDVLVNGRDVKEDPDGKNALEIGFVFQNPFTQISGIASTVYEELAYGLENMGVEPEEIRQRIERIMELTKIQEFRDRDPYQLSGGQQQRVALAAILVMDQDVLVIDEPTSQLDPQSTDDVFEIIKLMKSMGKTIVLVEHKMEQIAEYADQIIVLDGGQVVMEGTPKEVFSDPDCLKYHTRPPQSTRIALELKKEGVNLSEIPVTVEETVGMIRTAMEE